MYDVRDWPVLDGFWRDGVHELHGGELFGGAGVLRVSGLRGRHVFERGDGWLLRAVRARAVSLGGQGVLVSWMRARDVCARRGLDGVLDVRGGHVRYRRRGVWVRELLVGLVFGRRGQRVPALPQRHVLHGDRAHISERVRGV